MGGTEYNVSLDGLSKDSLVLTRDYFFEIVPLSCGRLALSDNGRAS